MFNFIKCIFHSFFDRFRIRSSSLSFSLARHDGSVHFFSSANRNIITLSTCTNVYQHVKWILFTKETFKDFNRRKMFLSPFSLHTVFSLVSISFSSAVKEHQRRNMFIEAFDCLFSSFFYHYYCYLRRSVVMCFGASLPQWFSLCVFCVGIKLLVDWIVRKLIL